jgi:hypothetical protein
MFLKFLIGVSLIAALFSLRSAVDAAPGPEPAAAPPADMWRSARDGARFRALYKRLIDAENRHDIAAIKPIVWNSPDALFVAANLFDFS